MAHHAQGAPAPTNIVPFPKRRGRPRASLAAAPAAPTYHRHGFYPDDPSDADAFVVSSATPFFVGEDGCFTGRFFALMLGILASYPPDLGPGVTEHVKAELCRLSEIASDRARPPLAMIAGGKASPDPASLPTTMTATEQQGAAACVL